MRKIKEVLRLKYECNLSERQIARSCQVSRTTVTDYLRRAIICRLNWSEATALTEVQLVERLFPVKPTVEEPGSIQRPAPDYEYIYKQLRTYQKINLTLTQLWLEYIFETKSQEKNSPLPTKINFSLRLGIPNNYEV